MVTARTSRVDSAPVMAILRDLIDAVEADTSETYYALSKRAGIPLPTLRRLVLGKFDTISIATAEKLAKALGLELRLEKQRAPRSSARTSPAPPATEEAHDRPKARNRKPTTRTPKA